MGVMDRVWDTLATVIKMNDRVEGMAATMVAQQARIEDLTGRVIRLETALEIALRPAPPSRSSPKRVE